MMDFIPALEHNDLKKIGDVVWEIEFRGFQAGRGRTPQYRIYQYMSMLREAGR